MTNSATFDGLAWLSNISDTSNSTNGWAEKYVNGIVKHMQCLGQPHRLVKSDAKELTSTSVEVVNELRFVTLDQTPEVIDGDHIIELLKKFKAEFSISNLTASQTKTALPVELQNEILEFSNLPRCWDGDEAEPINRDSINNALKFLKQYEGQLKFDAFPDPDGSVGLRSDIASGRILLSFSPDNTVAYFIRKQGVMHRGHGISLESVNKLLEAIL